MNVHWLGARTRVCMQCGRVTVRYGAQSQLSDQKTRSLKGEVFYVELINFLVAALSVQVVRFSPPHVAPPLDRDDAMIRRGQLLLLLYAVAL